jgi:hypothetical protein
MRPGYDRVYADTRGPIIPDLPVPRKIEPKKPEEDGRTGTVLGALFAVVLTIAGGLALVLGFD